ncbi:MAG TPA: HEAT repeat domain-containing protein [Gemmatimonadales bacterium]|nr:HEAT repeat domain-containing protein [Gemmatimonadales bacterium]
MDSKSAFVKRFGDLIALLRVDPGNDAAQDLALTAAAAAVESESMEIEAGVEWSVIPDELTLKGRLLARQVELIRVAAGAEPHELLALARALSHDAVPVHSSSHIEVEMVEIRTPPPSSPAPPDQGAASQPPPPPQPRRATERRAWEERRHPGRSHERGFDRRRGADRRVSGERRLHLIAGQRLEIAHLHEALGRSARAFAWDAVLLTAVALVRLAPRVPAAERRGFGIQVRRAIPRQVVEALVDLGERDAALRPRTEEVLRWIGLDAAEVILERLVQGEAVGVRSYYYDVLGGMPGVYPLVTPLLSSPQSHEIRHGAVLLGRLGHPAAIDELIPLLGHRDESVRSAGVRAMGEIHAGAAAEPLRQALHHPDGRTRAAAAGAISVWRGGALAILLVGALPAERDREAWHAMVTALGMLGTVETVAALTGVALARRNLVRRQGFSPSQRLAAVEALGLADSPPARRALERLATEAEGVVRYAADRILRAENQRAG